MANEQNLTPFQPGQSGNPAGMPPGTKQLATIVKRLLGEEKLVDKLLSKKPGWWDELPEKNGANAMVVAVLVQALNGDVKAFTALRKAGYGDMLDLTNSDASLRPVNVFDMRTNVQMLNVPIDQWEQGQAAILELAKLKAEIPAKKSVQKTGVKAKKPAKKISKPIAKKPVKKVLKNGS